MCPPDSFTLGDAQTGKKLGDDVTVGSLVPWPDGVRYVNFHSCSYYIQRQDPSMCAEYKTFIISDTYWCNVICKELGKTTKGKMHSLMTLPGGTVEYW